MTSSSEPKLQTGPSSLSDQVLGQIKCGACPMRPRYYFVGREWLMWSLWFLTVAVGSLTVAIVFWQGVNSYYALYEITHRSWSAFWLESAPYLGLIIFCLLLFLMLYEVRSTNRGYRAAGWVVFGSSLVASVFGGATLHVLHISHSIDRDLGLMSQFYESQIKRELRHWQQPSAGRLVGVWESVFGPVIEESRPGFHRLRDHEGQIWQIKTDHLSTAEIELLLAGEPVRIYGLNQPEQELSFYACGVYPVLSERSADVSAYRETRRRFEAAWYASSSTRDDCMNER